MNSKKNKIDKFELVLTSKEGNKPLKLGKKFDNPITVDGTMEANMISMYLFEYKGHKAFLSANFMGKEWVSYQMERK